MPPSPCCTADSVYAIPVACKHSSLRGERLARQTVSSIYSISALTSCPVIRFIHSFDSCGALLSLLWRSSKSFWRDVGTTKLQGYVKVGFLVQELSMGFLRTSALTFFRQKNTVVVIGSTKVCILHSSSPLPPARTKQ